MHDARGRLSQVTAAGGTTSFTINALGERITKSGPLTPGGTNVFHYGPTGKLIGIAVAGQDNWTDILYLGNAPVAMLTGTAATPAISILQADHLDTVMSIMNAAAVQVWRWDRDPYGAFVPNEDPDGDGNFVRFDLRFPGQVLDRETGLHYNYFRDYDPAIGRYVQSDPIGLAGGVNTYTYVENMPLSKIDPSGLITWAAPIGIALGGAAILEFIDYGGRLSSINHALRQEADLRRGRDAAERVCNTQYVPRADACRAVDYFDRRLQQCAQEILAAGSSIADPKTGPQTAAERAFDRLFNR